MAFFPQGFYNNATSATDSSFTPLFRLLDDFDSYSRQGQGQSQGHGRRTAMPTWQPKFDIRETGNAYELHGELPGLNKQDVHIEFTDPQTLVVRGRVERNYPAGTSPADFSEDGNAEQRRNSRQATVEDEADAESERAVQQEHDDPDEVAPTAGTQQPIDKAKYWLTERSIGEFTRSFSFPTRLEQDEVAASLKDGVLSLTVPKAKKHETRRIAIN